MQRLQRASGPAGGWKAHLDGRWDRKEGSAAGDGEAAHRDNTAAEWQ